MQWPLFMLGCLLILQGLVLALVLPLAKIIKDGKPAAVLPLRLASLILGVSDIAAAFLLFYA